MWDNRKEYYEKNRHYRYHKTGDFYSLTEVCKALGVSVVTYRNYEGKLFPLVQRDEAGRRLFTQEDIEQIKGIWKEYRKGN